MDGPKNHNKSHKKVVLVRAPVPRPDPVPVTAAPMPACPEGPAGLVEWLQAALYDAADLQQLDCHGTDD